MLGTEDNLSGEMNLVLSDPPYNAQRSRIDDHADYDVFGSNYVKNMTKVLQNVMSLIAHV